VPTETTEGRTARSIRHGGDAPVGQETGQTQPPNDEATNSATEKALTIGFVAISLGVLAGKAVVSGIHNWLKKKVPGTMEN